MRVTIANARTVGVRAVLILTLAVAALAAATASARAASPHYTYGPGCVLSSYRDPLNVRWFNIGHWGLIDSTLRQYMDRWSTVGGSTQYAYNRGSCQAELVSLGREWGRPVSTGQPKYKIHARVFETGTDQFATDAHQERKARCSSGSVKDAVYRRYNGRSGFDAAMHKVVAAYRARSSMDVSVVRSTGRFTRLFKQCTGEVVKWSGDVAYIFRQSG